MTNKWDQIFTWPYRLQFLGGKIKLKKNTYNELIEKILKEFINDFLKKLYHQSPEKPKEMPIL